jgi:hypothetical protein
MESSHLLSSTFKITFKSKVSLFWRCESARVQDLLLIIALVFTVIIIGEWYENNLN